MHERGGALLGRCEFTQSSHSEGVICAALPQVALAMATKVEIRPGSIVRVDVDRLPKPKTGADRWWLMSARHKGLPWRTEPAAKTGPSNAEGGHERLATQAAGSAEAVGSTPGAAGRAGASAGRVARAGLTHALHPIVTQPSPPTPTRAREARAKPFRERKFVGLAVQP